ncbi:pyridoxal phosphate-dependent aminotransferase [Actinoplanes cyaneus]|uniref:Pyridoxal phosphate-dependent aminotransferase n=1 Tax=Actinoplanes cyaneus TaxID=52696 RepID=A0A919IQ87_9ACTN|nr:aminotransferase class I/II-fold pyridoxal phosphate-dependent enzyme [Actinoplanes cyaneus]MCW2140957.1 dTDP-4-amino-4,6-dideoxygalactose transaminase [Actinoplanes cyaneus]GID69211.1 pyridoxal phosphate-dependent aminotransferase [Actinoplanes cyaneus]
MTEPAERTPRIYLSPPDVTDVERKLLLEAFDSNWVAPVGPDLEAFEDRCAEVTGVRHAVALSSGTAALHLALIAAGVRRGDTVLVPSFTFAATANAVMYLGARPVFLDSTPESWNVDPQIVADELRGRAVRGNLPRAVITVDLYGQCADYEPILDACDRYGIPLIEDAAEALGATYRGRAAGSFGQAGVLSFNGNKIATTGGGGVLVTDDGSIATQARHLATQAREPVLHYEHRTVGYNYRLSNLLAAVGRGQLQRLPRLVEARRATFEHYRAALGDLPGVTFQPGAAHGVPNRWLTCLLLDHDQRDRVIAELDRVNIEARPTWKPMHLQPVYRDCVMRGGSVSADLFHRGLCLPSGSALTPHDRDRVVSVVRSVVMQ